VYETEANGSVEPPDQLSPEVISAFARLRGKIVARTVLPWSEHCTECVWPTCYSTCELYSPREDGGCRRFVDGMVRVNCPTAVNHYLLKIRFKRWGKLWTPGSLQLHPTEEAEKIESLDYRVGTILYQLPLPAPMKKVITCKRYNMKKRAAARYRPAGEVPTCILLECFNPMKRAISLSLTIRSFNNERKIPFQRLIDLGPGFHLLRIPFEEVSSILNLDSPFHIEVIPNDVEEEVTLYFGLMEFVQEARPVAEEKRKVKCVVWDLDNTLWDGVLVEGGPGRLRLKPGILPIIQDLDGRGILQSIASKNNHEEAMQVLRQFGIDEFFLYPQISWAPKGEAVSAIAGLLNISLDTILFVDDSEFELQQVRAACRGVMVLDAKDYLSILRMKECQLPPTAESVNRRKMYQVERTRSEMAQNFKDDYKAFLRYCNIQLTIQHLAEENIERVHELTQRTNQMNFSGNRYHRELLKNILLTPYLDAYVLVCEDRFGSYGTIGFGIVDNREPRLTDLMFSCRIQSKRVEHAFLGYLIRKYIAMTGKDFHADYRKTPRNSPSGRVFADLGVREIGTHGDVTSLVFPRETEIPDDGIVQIVVQESIVPVD
jgi:FkbH-like protein